MSTWHQPRRLTLFIRITNKFWNLENEIYFAFWIQQRQCFTLFNSIKPILMRQTRCKSCHSGSMVKLTSSHRILAMIIIKKLTWVRTRRFAWWFCTNMILIRHYKSKNVIFWVNLKSLCIHTYHIVMRYVMDIMLWPIIISHNRFDCVWEEKTK